MAANLHNKFNEDWESAVSKPSIPWEKSKEDVWAELERKLDAPTSKPEVHTNSQPTLRIGLRWAMSAAAVLVLAVGMFMRMYTVEQLAASGRHLQVVLPDGSEVHLNADSKLAYNPYWWWAKREVRLSGEAYFEVAKGERFDVVSAQAVTSVLGTSFNVLARNKRYEVNCLTGRVRVESLSTAQSVVLQPNEKAIRNADGSVAQLKNVNAADARAWTEHRFVFTNSPLSEVLQEVARQYGVTIELPDSLEAGYTGNFPKTDDVAQTLRLICRPFGYTFAEKQTHVYAIGKP